MTGAGKPLCVILVEPDGPLIRLLGWLFEEEGFAVRTVTGAADAAQEDHAVVILNTNMSAQEKDALITEWRRLAPEMRFIDIHERRSPRDDPHQWSGADAHFEMPFDSDQLLETARSMLTQA